MNKTNEVLLTTIEMLKQIKIASTIKTRRNFMDFFGDRLRQAVNEPTLLKTIEVFQKLLAVEVTYLGKDRIKKFIIASMEKEAYDVLNWIREYPLLAVTLCFMDEEDSKDAIESLEIRENVLNEIGKVKCILENDIEIDVTCLSPLAHGGDMKVGNASVFRRMDVFTDTGHIITLPYYAGNALRGQMRDLLADHFLSSLGITPDKTNPPINLWFFHCLYSGGALEEKNKATEKISKFAGATAQKAENIFRIRQMMPALSALGFAFGNRILAGRIIVCDLRPVCCEWGFPNTTTTVNDLFQWEFLTRREDHEGHEKGDNSSMIANTECLKAGTLLHGGIDILPYASELEISAIGKGLELLQKNGYIGAENRRGFGNVEISYSKIPDSSLYEKFLKEKRQEIVGFLKNIDAIEETKLEKAMAQFSTCLPTGRKAEYDSDS